MSNIARISSNPKTSSVWPRPHWTFDHLGHVVPELDAAIQFYVAQLGFTEVLRETVSSQKVNVAFLQLGSFLLELLAPIDESSIIIMKFLERRGPGLHHISYRVPSVEMELKALSQAGVKLVDEQPRAGSRGLSVAFIYPSESFGALIELCGNP